MWSPHNLCKIPSPSSMLHFLLVPRGSIHMLAHRTQFLACVARGHVFRAKASEKAYTFPSALPWIMYNQQPTWSVMLRCICIPCIPKSAQFPMWISILGIQGFSRTFARSCLLWLVFSSLPVCSIPWHTIYKKIPKYDQSPSSKETYSCRVARLV